MVGALPQIFLRSEGAVLLALTVFLYGRADASWTLFGLVFLAPDLSMVGYAAGPRAGAIAYNSFHTYLLPAVLLAIGVVTRTEPALAVAMIWFAHIGADRMLGFGLKETSGFRYTHLGSIGRPTERPGSGAE